MAWRVRSRPALPPSAPDVAAALIVLGDQPRLSVATIRAILDCPDDPARPIVAPRYDDDGGRNPVLLGRAAFGLVAEVHGDRGLGPILAAHPELVQEVIVSGANPDVDTREDLAALAEAAWADRVRANNEQVDRFREVPDGKDFYAPVRSLFRADPTRTDDPVLAALLRVARPGRYLAGRGCGRRSVRAAARSGA